MPRRVGGEARFRFGRGPEKRRRAKAPDCSNRRNGALDTVGQPEVASAVAADEKRRDHRSRQLTESRSTSGERRATGLATKRSSPLTLASLPLPTQSGHASTVAGTPPPDGEEKPERHLGSPLVPDDCESNLGSLRHVREELFSDVLATPDPSSDATFRRQHAHCKNADRAPTQIAQRTLEAVTGRAPRLGFPRHRIGPMALLETRVRRAHRRRRDHGSNRAPSVRHWTTKSERRRERATKRRG